MDVTGVEIDEKITDLAHTYFALDKEIPVTTYDGRAYLAALEEKYDVIMVDAYQDITIPFQMSSTEFFSLVRDHLKPGGVMVVNMNMHSETQGQISTYLSDTIHSVFPHVVTADVTGSTNRELFASMDVDLKSALSGNTGNLAQPELKSLMRQVQAGLNKYTGDTHIFTDDKAPVELLGMETIDGLIKNEIGVYKEVYKEKGLQGLLEIME